MGGGDQSHPRRDAHPVADGEVSSIGQLFHDDQVVRDVDVSSYGKATEPEQPDSGAREEGIPGPPLENLLPKAPGEAHALTPDSGRGRYPAVRPAPATATRPLP